MTSSDIPMDGLSKFEVMVVRELNQNRRALEAMSEEISSIRGEISRLKISQREVKIRSSLWGSVVSALVSIAAWAAWYFSKAK